MRFLIALFTKRSSLEPDNKNTKAMNPRVQHALLELMVGQMYYTVIVAIMVSLLMGFVVAPTYGVLIVSLWVTFGALIGIGRVVIFKRFMPAFLARQQYQLAINTIVLALMLSGLHWGVAAWLFLDPQNPDIYLFVAVVILGMVSASLANLSAFPYLWLLHSVIVFVFVIARMVFYDYWSGVIASVVFIGGLWGLSRKLGDQILSSITKDFENAQLLEEVNIAKEIAEQANVDKSRFMAATSHDLRQPLYAQSLLLAALKDQLTTDVQADIMIKLSHSNQALNTLFESLLEISQLDANTIKVNRSHQSLLDVSEDLISEFEALAIERNLTLDLQGEDVAVWVDPVLLKRIVRNLLSNALKYTRDGGVILRIEQHNNIASLSVLDTGLGISESDQSRIFDEYVQLNNQARDRNKGVGLGLALVQRMCLLLEHEIKLTSTLGKGSCFSISLPLGDASKTVSIKTEASGLSVAGLTIFVIDDDIPILDSMRQLEPSWECRFKLFSSILEVSSYIKNNNDRPDVIVSDYRLAGGVTGIDVINQCQAHYGADIPAMLITGDTDPELLSEIERIGIHMLHKPIDAEKLKAVLAILANR